ncbi:MAG: hypothetical protein QOF18_710 [Frankiaceae bacterium]|jgi:FkbM family methyltransferase|nr:hypothetical protein [Frankiaceae bacterium]
MPSLRDLVASVAGRVGLDVEPIAPGAALLTRRRATSSGERTSPYRVARATARTVIVTPRSHDAQFRKLERGTYKWLGPEHLRHIINTYEINCVLDVGANTGQYGELLRGVGYRGHIVSFEPVPRVFRQLRRATVGDRRWNARRLALGRENGSLDLFVVSGTCSSALPASRYGMDRFTKLAEPKQVTVPVRRLDEILAEVLPSGLADPRVLLKLDTQGYDLEAFAGLGDGVRQVVALQSELAQVPIYEGMPTMQQSLDVFQAAGYEITGLFPVTRDPRTARVLEFDCVMVRGSAFPEPSDAGSAP